MCESCDQNYAVYPSLVIGGTTGDYFIQCPVTSCRWAEFQVISIANGSQAAQVLVSGDSPPQQLDYTGSKTLSDNAIMRGIAYTVPNNGTLVPSGDIWQRITHSQKRVFVRIDNASSNSTYISIRFRTRLLKVIPDTKDAVPHMLEHQANIQRSERIKERTQDLPKTLKGDHCYA